MQSRTLPRLAFYTCLAVIIVGVALALRDGSTSMAVRICLLLLAFPALFFTVTRPLVFPCALYVLALPMENVATVGQNLPLTRFLAAATAVGLLLWCLRKGAAIRPHASLGILLLLLGWIGASIYWTTDQAWGYGLFTRTFAELAFVYVAFALFPIGGRDLYWFIGLIVASGVIASVYGIHAFYHMAPVDSGGQRLFGGGNSGGPSIDPNQFADTLLLPAAATIMLALRARRRLEKVAYGSALVLLSVVLLLSGSREAALGLTVMIVYYTIRSRYRLQLVPLIAVLGILTAVIGSPLWSRLTTQTQRPSVWAVGIAAFKHRWMTGYGIGSFPDAYNRYYLLVHQQFPNGWSSPPHSLIIHYAVELGVVGLSLIALFCFVQLFELRQIKPASELYDFRLMAEAGMIGLLVVSSFIDLFTYRYAWLVFAFVALVRNAAIGKRAYERQTTQATNHTVEIRAQYSSINPTRS